MRLLFLGDLLGRAGRTAAINAIPDLRKTYNLDFVCVNAENAAAGFGITSGIVDALLTAGVDAITLGNHAFDNKEILAHLHTYPQLVRPINIARSAPGIGNTIVTTQKGKRVHVVNVLGRIFMNPTYSDPFEAVDKVLLKNPLKGIVDATIIDIHAEATSEKMAFGHWIDGRASLVVGTHTHIPTADLHILGGGTAYQTDAGMCGDYNSVIGMDKDEPVRRFVTGMNEGRFTPAVQSVTLCGVFVETDDLTGLAKSVAPFRQGGILPPAFIQTKDV